MLKTKLVIVCVLLALYTFNVCAQDKPVIKWIYSAKLTGNGTYEIHIAGIIEKGWHIYSQTTPAGGPIPTSITFTKNPVVTFLGETKEIGKPEQHHEPLFGVDVKQYSNRVEFVQTVKIPGNIKTSVKGKIEFMTCNDHECLPPKSDNFSVSIN